MDANYFLFRTVSFSPSKSHSLHLLTHEHGIGRQLHDFRPLGHFLAHRAMLVAEQQHGRTRQSVVSQHRHAALPALALTAVGHMPVPPADIKSPSAVPTGQVRGVPLRVTRDRILYICLINSFVKSRIIKQTMMILLNYVGILTDRIAPHRSRSRYPYH